MNPSAVLPLLQPPVTLCVLCYGDHAALAERCLSSLVRHTPREAIRLRIGLNAVSPSTEQAVARWREFLEVEMVTRSPVNLYKNPMMRRLFYDQPIETAWTIWFDDDSHVFRSDWLSLLGYASRLQPQVDMWGRTCFVRGDDHYRAFIRSAPWYQGLPEQEDDRPGGCRLSFVVGGFWAIRTSWLYRLNWPESRVLQLGDDYILGEALRQNGGRIGNAYSGVAIDRAPRRAPPETPRCEVLH